MIRRLEFHLSYACSQGCAFCSESGRMARFARFPVSRKEIGEVLIRKRREGFDHVTLTGGEPTIHPDFLWTLKAAKSLGYRTYVTSNGSRLASPDFAGQALPLIDELCLSVHGHCPGLHDQLTSAPGSFERLREAFRNVGGYGGNLFLLTNTVATALNGPFLKDILKFILGFGKVRHCLFSNLAPEGRGGRAYRLLALPLTQWRREIPELALLRGREGPTLRFFGLPLCVFGDYHDYSNDLYFSPRVTVERMRLKGGAALKEITSLAPTRRRRKPGACRPCAARAVCGGVFARYLEEFGGSELDPIDE